MAMKEIYTDANVMITTAIATIFGVSYPIAAITSISVREDRIQAQAGTVASGCLVVTLLTVGLLLLAGGALAMLGQTLGPPPNAAHDVTSTAIGMMIIGVFFAAIGRSVHLGRERQAATPADYVLAIVTAAGEHAAIRAKDRGYIEHIRSCIEHAIQER